MAITRTPIVDDDGSGTTGTIWNDAWMTQLYDQIDASSGGAVVQTTTSTGTQNNLTLTAGASLLRCNNASLLTLTGLAAGADGQRLTIVSIGAGRVDLSHQDAGSTAANRLVNFATSGKTSLAAGAGAAIVVYDATTARWRMTAHEQGAWLTATFAAGNFTALTGGTWTVDSGDVLACTYRLSGRTLTLAIYLATTTVVQSGGNPLALQISNAAWGGFTAANTMLSIALANDNGGGNGLAFFQISGGTTQVQLYKGTLGQWAAATNNTSAFGQISFEVQ